MKGRVLRRKMFVVGVLVATAICAYATEQTEYFVDINRPDDSGNGLTTNTAFKTIQAAVAAAAAGDIVTVLPGEYAEEPVQVTDGDKTTRHSLSRLYIDKRITLRSLEGAAKTHIVGRYSTKTTIDGMGADAVRCISVDSGKAVGAVIEGFTIRDGASGSQDDNGNDVATGSKDGSCNRAGGVNTTKNYDAAVGMVYTVVDCVVSNCVGTRGGGLYCGKAVRTLFIDNRAVNYGAAGRQIAAYNCVFTRNRKSAKSSGTGIGILAYGLEQVNCTFVDNHDTYVFIAQSGKVYNCLFVNNSHEIYDGTTSSATTKFFNCVSPNATITSKGTACRTGNDFETINPLVDDYRLTHTAKSVGAGDVQYLENIPEEYRGTDFYGKPRLTGDVLNAGAVQEFATVLGVIKLSTASGDAQDGNLCVNGRVVKKTTIWCCSTRPHELLRVSAVPASETYGVRNYLLASQLVWPFLDDSGALVYPQDGTTVTAGVVCRPIFWADPAADDSGSGSKDEPFQTLQAAADAAAANNPVGIVFAKEGDYDKGGAYSSKYGVTNRLWISGDRYMRVKAVGDRSKTTIWGASDSTSADGTGCGRAAVRCVLFSSTRPCLIQGFTLRGGRTAYSSSYSEGDQYRGGCFYGGDIQGIPAAAADCVLTDGCAGRGAAAIGCNLYRCIVTNNVVAGTGNAIFRTGSAYSCLFKDNNAKTYYLIGQSSTIINCTLAGNRMSTSGNNRLVACSYGGKQWNCVFGDTLNAIRTFETASTGFDCVANQGAVSADCVKDEPYFADEANGDFRLLGASAGADLARLDRDGYTYDARTAYDLNGKLFPIDGNGRFPAGCYADLVPAYRGVSTVAGGISSTTPTRVDEAGTVTFTATADRPLLRFELNGEDVGYALDSDGKGVYTLSYDPAKGVRWIVTAVYGSDWYVSPAGSDANNGWSRETPFKTLKYAAAKTLEGDTIHAARGTYDEGEYTPGEGGGAFPYSGSSKSRVFLAAGRSLISDEGAAVTFIKGHDDPDYRASDYGLGPNALRCVTLEANALLKGFTLVDGHTGRMSTDQIYDNRGGGAYSEGTSAHVEDCVITNCVAYRGGGIYGGSAYRCRIVGNRARSMGTGPRDTALYDSYIDGNFGSCVYYGPLAQRCTFGPSNRSEDGKSAPQYLVYSVNDSPRLAVDCLFAECGKVEVQHATNCVFQSQSRMNATVSSGNWKDGKTPEAIAACRLVAGDGSPVVDAAGRPMKGCPAIDRIPLADFTGGETDADGEQRVFNNAADVGCFDYDWRPDYSQQIARSRAFAVTSAPPTCVSTDAGVLLLDGTATATWGGATGTIPHSVNVRVTGAGELTIKKDGEVLRTLTAQDGEQEVAYSAASHGLDFAYAKAPDDTDEVGALILGAKRRLGLVIVVE